MPFFMDCKPVCLYFFSIYLRQVIFCFGTKKVKLLSQIIVIHDIKILKRKMLRVDKMDDHIIMLQ